MIRRLIDGLGRDGHGQAFKSKERLFLNLKKTMSLKPPLIMLNRSKHR